jgi:hypothetical protein
MNRPHIHPADDYDSEDGFNSTSSTDVEDNDTPDNAPAYQLQTPLCIVRNLPPKFVILFMTLLRFVIRSHRIPREGNNIPPVGWLVLRSFRMFRCAALVF